MSDGHGWLESFPYGITWEEHRVSQGRHDDEPDDLGDIFPDAAMKK